MRYVLLIYSNRASWAGLPADQRQALAQTHAALSAELTASGQLVGGEGLSDPINTRTVKVRDGVTSTTDGPFVESKEHLAGFYIVECGSEDEAIALAARLPDAHLNAVEVRPVNLGAPHDGLLPG